MKKNIFKYSSIFYNLKIFDKILIVNLFIWIMSIPVKNIFFQFSSSLFLILFIYSLYINSLKNFKFILNKYKDIAIAFLIIIFSMFLSNLFSEYSDLNSYRKIIDNIIKYYLLLFILLYFYYEKKISIILILFFSFISLFFYSIFGLYELVYNLNLQKPIEGIISGTGVFGMIMSLGSFLSLYCYFKLIGNKFIKSYPFFMLYGYFSLMTLASFSRTSWLILFIFTFLIILKNIKALNIKFILAMVGVTILFTYILYTNSSLTIRFNQLIAFNDGNRFVIWIDTLELIKNRILLGYGMIDFTLIGFKNYYGTHNSILEVLLFTGLIGFIAFFNLIFIIIKDLFVNKRYDSLLILFILFFISLTTNGVLRDKIFLSILTLTVFLSLAYRIDFDKNDKD